MEGKVLTPISRTLRNSTRPKLRLVALSSPGGFSGLPEAVLRELAGYCQVASVIDGLRCPRVDRLWMAARAFRPGRTKWGRRYYAALGRYTKTPSTLLARIQRCERELARLQGTYEIIYQFGALFGALERPDNAPLVLHLDFTTRLAEEHYPDWLPASKSATEQWNEIEKKIYHSADLIVVPTPLVAGSLAEHYGVAPDKVSVVGMGAHIEDLTDDFAKHQRPMLVFAGPDFSRHGGELAMEIFRAVRQHIPSATMMTVTNRSFNAPGVRNVGIVPRAQLHEILREAAILLVPGAVGGYQTVTEGMAAKCLCVVAKDNPHMAGLIQHGTNGLAIRRTCTSETVDVLRQHLEHPERCAALGDRARLHVLEECAWPRVVARVWKEIENQLYHALPDGPPSRS